MNLRDLSTRVDYDEWATGQLVDAVRALGPEEQTRDLGAGFRSIAGTMTHLLAGEWLWLRFLRDGVDSAAEVGVDGTSPTAWSALWDERRAYHSALSESTLSDVRVVDAERTSVGDLLEHVLTHAIHHRGQVVLLLRSLGRQPPALEFRRFLRAGSDS